VSPDFALEEKAARHPRSGLTFCEIQCCGCHGDISLHIAFTDVALPRFCVPSGHRVARIVAGEAGEQANRLTVFISMK
jgi:hypothetical protein